VAARNRMIFMKYNRVGRARQALQYLPKLIANNKPKKLN
jgi:hypothetical protein